MWPLIKWYRAFFVKSLGVDGGVNPLGHTAGSALEKSVQCRRAHFKAILRQDSQ